MRKFNVGDGVRVADGPMQGMVVWFYEKQDKYLVRFSGLQQMYYDEEQVFPW